MSKLWTTFLIFKNHSLRLKTEKKKKNLLWGIGKSSVNVLQSLHAAIKPKQKLWK